MAKTVNAAFIEFLKETVNLDGDQTTKARKSRDWLLEQIASFDDDDTFPKLWQPYNIHFGSFARKTKKRPLDDIDLIIGLHAQGAYYCEYSDRIELVIHPESNLKDFCKDGTSILSSTKILNKFVEKLKTVPQYKYADPKRVGEAATINLSSYEWTFDIVPCFFTSLDQNCRDYYLIPDGNGNWKKTDPRMDRDRVQNINQKHNGRVLNVIRIMKYWNKRPTMPDMPSYLMENIILDYYQNQLIIANERVDIEIPKILQYISTKIHLPVNDPKNIQGNINTLTIDKQNKISERAKLDYQRAIEAKAFEDAGEQEKSIKKWAEIFGSEFPKYE